MINALIESFAIFPVGAGLYSFQQAGGIVASGAHIFSLGLQLALPFIAVLLIVNLALGVMMRVAPQLNLISVGMPATISVGAACLFMLLPYLEQPLTRAIEHSIAGLAR